MLSQEQRDKILNNPNFVKLTAKPVVSENAGLTMRERREKAKELSTNEEKGFLSRVKEDLGERVETINEKARLREEGKISGFSQVLNFASQGFGALGDTAFEALVSATPDVIKDKAKELGANVLQTNIGKAGLEAVKSGAEAWENFKINNPETATNIESLANFAEIIPVERGASLGIKGVKSSFRIGENIGKTGFEEIGKLGKNIFNKTKEISPAINQTTKDFLSRVPRAVEHAKDYSLEATKRAERIKKAIPEVGNAIDVGVEDKTLNNILEATTNTKKEMRKMIDIVEDSSDVMPSSLAGESSVKQYEIIDKARKKVGEKLNKAIEKLPNTKVSISRKLADLDKTLRQNGLKIQDKQIVRTSSSNITEAELNAINKLYNESIRGVDNIGLLDAKSIQAKNSLISKLKRESSRIENIDDIIIKKPDGTTTSIYSAFKDMFSETLDEISPEIRDINREYATYRNIVDEIDNSILKSSKTNLNINPAESASINLRRVSGEALSTPYFQEVARLMDATARKLGYDGADPVRLINFAEDLRKLYPEAIPRTGFQGGIRTGVSDLADRLIKAGAPNIKDKQKAIKEILDKTSKKIIEKTDEVKKGGIKNFLKDLKDNEAGFIKIPGKEKVNLKEINDLERDYILGQIDKAGGYKNLDIPADQLKFYDEIFKRVDKVKDTKNDIFELRKLAKKNNLLTEEIFNKSNKTDDLISEAKKYKSANEFIKAQDIPIVDEKKGLIEIRDNYLQYSYDGDDLVIDMIKVKDKRKGIGTQLMNEAEKVASKDGLNISLVSSPQDKTISPEDLHSFYKSLGYSDMGGGYDGTLFEKSNSQLWSGDFKTKSQLIDIWNKANKKDDLISKRIMPEGFVSNFEEKGGKIGLKKEGIDIDNNGTITLYHGTSPKNAKSIEKNGFNSFTFFTTDEKVAKSAGGKVLSIKAKPDELLNLGKSMATGGSEGITFQNSLPLENLNGIYQIKGKANK